MLDLSRVTQAVIDLWKSIDVLADIAKKATQRRQVWWYATDFYEKKEVLLTGTFQVWGGTSEHVYAIVELDNGDLRRVEWNELYFKEPESAVS